MKNCGNYVQKYNAEEGSDECEAVAVYLYPELLQTIYRNEVPSFLTDDSVPEPKKLIGNQLIEQYMTNLSIYFEEPDTFDEKVIRKRLNDNSRRGLNLFAKALLEKGGSRCHSIFIMVSI